MLNHIDKVNDLTEHKRIDDFYSKKVYVSCFTSRERESLFFWETYSHRRDGKIGVRVSFPIDILEHNHFYFDSECNREIPLIKNTNFAHKEYCNDDDWGLINHYSIKMIYHRRAVTVLNVFATVICFILGGNKCAVL